MKKILVLAICFSISFCVQSQLIKKITDKAKQKSDEKAEEVLNGKKNEKKTTESTENNNASASTSTSNQPASLKTYSKFDFVPGEKVIGFEDFSTGDIGDFPAGWNTNGSAEIVTIEGKPGRWLALTKAGEFIPEFAKEYPEDFTLEFDLLHAIPFQGGNFYLCIAELQDINRPEGWGVAVNQFNVEFEIEIGVSRFYGRKNHVTDIQNMTNSNLDKTNPVHIAVWRQKERVRIYLNEEKLWDIPKASIKEAKYNSIIFVDRSSEGSAKHYIGNLRLAIGAPDTRKKFLEQSKWVTHGILFDVNSDKIKPESYGTLKEMATILKEYPDVKMRIIGHTDADGKDADNLDLSKRRAASVKQALAKEFSIDASRMETDGKGESEPIDKNDNPAGKANNRRVEFIKI